LRPDSPTLLSLQRQQQQQHAQQHCQQQRATSVAVQQQGGNWSEEDSLVLVESRDPGESRPWSRVETLGERRFLIGQLSVKTARRPGPCNTTRTAALSATNGDRHMQQLNATETTQAKQDQFYNTWSILAQGTARRLVLNNSEEELSTLVGLVIWSIYLCSTSQATFFFLNFATLSSVTHTESLPKFFTQLECFLKYMRLPKNLS
jgi:hypothetical protein